MKENMINAYFIIPLVVGIVLSYLWLIHRLWLRSVFSEYHKPTVDAKIAGEEFLQVKPRMARESDSGTVRLSHNESQN